jgi:glutamyl-tRNA synthetase
MTVITRFAPSPTGYLHIGGARTALFNYLFSRHHGGKFLLRIEDTDRARSTPEAIDAILTSMAWLELDHDDDVVYQFARAPRHREVAEALVRSGAAYYCYEPPRELAATQDPNNRFVSPWRDAPANASKPDIAPVIRLKAPLTGTMVIDDLVQKRIEVAHAQLDDMVLLRADGTPTYMLAVVVDDHDMHISHIIRGDDHLTNAFRQTLLYQALGWDIPHFAHIPLIHGPDGSKLSKRHGAIPVEEYRDLGILPEALCNYLVRLGWSHGNEELIDRKQAIEWFDLDHVGRSPSRFDMAKLYHVNAHYMRMAEPTRLIALLEPILGVLDDIHRARILQGMEGLLQRSKNLVELTALAKLYVIPPARPYAVDAETWLASQPDVTLLDAIRTTLSQAKDWSQPGLQAICQQLADQYQLKLGAIAQWIRVALTGATHSPSVFEIMAILGKDDSLARLTSLRSSL